MLTKLSLWKILQEDPAFEGYDLSRVRTEVGPHKKDTLLNATQLVISPGIPLTQPDIAAAIQAVSITTYYTYNNIILTSRIIALFLSKTLCHTQWTNVYKELQFNNMLPLGTHIFTWLMVDGTRLSKDSQQWVGN